jgi:hypothetical protein
MAHLIARGSAACTAASYAVREPARVAGRLWLCRRAGIDMCCHTTTPCPACGRITTSPGDYGTSGLRNEAKHIAATGDISQPSFHIYGLRVIRTNVGEARQESGTAKIRLVPIPDDHARLDGTDGTNLVLPLHSHSHERASGPSSLGSRNRGTCVGV